MNACKNDAQSTRWNGNEFSSNGAKNYIPVADFYNGKSVFVTGGTGFLGMVLVEKLLYSCTGIEKIFMLVREKKGVSPDQRMKQFINDPLFQRLKDEKPHFFNKLVPINGDISDPTLGISNKDVETLTEEVSVVFHSAATVRFNDKLSVPLQLNFKATMKLLEMSKKMKNLEMFVHISTAYANITHNKYHVKEALPEPPPSLDQIYDFVAKYDNDEKITTKFLNGRFNTYALTKGLTEHHLAKNKEHVPTVIVRPAAVTATADGPVPGWLNDWQAVTRALYNVAMGHMRVLPGRKMNVVDLIPVDYVANLIIIAAAKSDRTKDLPIYNCCSSSVNPVTWGEAFSSFTKEYVRRGKNDLPFPFLIFLESKISLWITTVLIQVLPAYAADFWLTMTRRQPRYVQLYKRMTTLRNAMDFFLRYAGVMENHNVLKIEKTLSEKDRQLFPCNPADINWEKYMLSYAQGVDKYLVKSDNKK